MSITEIRKNARPTGSTYNPFSSSVPVDYVPKLTRRRNYYLRSIAAGAAVSSAPVREPGGKRERRQHPEFPVLPGATVLLLSNPSPHIFHDDELAVLGYYDEREWESSSVVKLERFWYVTKRSLLSPGATVPDWTDERPQLDTAHECDDDTACYVCRPLTRREKREKRPKKRRTGGGFRNNTGNPVRVFNGATGQNEWR